jgi:hypothetical protein
VLLLILYHFLVVFLHYFCYVLIFLLAPYLNDSVGIATNTDPKNLAIFAGSLRLRAKSQATVILFINSPIDDLTKRISTLYSLILIEFSFKGLEPAFLQKYHASSLRWILFHRLFIRNRLFFSSLFNKILTLDIRDSTFQMSPFPLIDLNETRLFVFGEVAYSRIAECGWNSGWIRDCFGEEALTKVGDQAIICSGVSMGLTHHMIEYIRIMNEILMGNKGLSTASGADSVEGAVSSSSLASSRSSKSRFPPVFLPTSKFPSCERNGVDQGVHNYIIHSNLLPFEVSVKYPESFPVVNMQSATDILPLPDDFTTVTMTLTRELYAILHQYDRNTELQLALGKKYIDWIDWTHPELERKVETHCSHFSFLENYDILRGKCDIGSGRAMTSASCCSICVNKGKQFDSVTGNFNEKECTGKILVLFLCCFLVLISGFFVVFRFFFLSLSSSFFLHRFFPCRFPLHLFVPSSGFTYVNGVCYLKDCSKEDIKASVDQYENEKQNPSTSLFEMNALTAYIKL